MIKIAHVITRLDKGGSTDNTLYSALLADKSRFSVTVISGPSVDIESMLQKRARDSGVCFLSCTPLSRSINPFRDLRALISLRRIFKTEQFNLVHTHTSKAGILGRIAARLAGVPAIVHTPHGHVFWGYYAPLLTRVFVFAERFCGRFSQKLICLTEQEKADYVRLRIEPASKIEVIPSGVEIQALNRRTRKEIRGELGIPADTFVLVTLARFEPVKNHVVLLKTARILKASGFRFLWIFAGDGELYNQFKFEADPIDSTLFRFLGWRSDAAQLLPGFDLFVLASNNEGMGRVFVEAQASGLPVVASDICGIRDVVKQGVTGLLLPSSDAEGIAAAVLRLARNPELHKKMGDAGKKWMSEGFDADGMVRRLEALYFSMPTRA